MGWMNVYFAIPLAALLHWLLLMVVQGQLSALIDFLNARERPLPSGRAIPDLYYPFSLIRGNYELAWYLYRHKTPEADVGSHFPDYPRLRRLSNLALWSHCALGAIIIGGVLWHQWISTW